MNPTRCIPASLMALSLAVALAGCGGGDALPPGVSAPTPPSPPPPAPAPSAQTITFTSPGNQTLGTAPPALSATASSGLAVTITSTTASVCTVSGTTLTLVAAGSCTLAANQAGDATYAAAQQQTVTFTVSSSTVTALTFSSGFAAGNLTNEGGAYFGYGGSNEDGFSCSNPAWCGSGSGGSGATSFFYAYYQTPTPATGLYNGASVLAPGVTALSTTADTAGVQVNGQTSVNFTFNENPEWASSGTSNFGVILTLGKFYNVGSAGSPAPCNIKLLAVVSPLNGGAAAAYSIPFSSFAVIQACNTNLNTPAAALASAPVSAIDFQGDGGTAALPPVNGLTTGANLTVPTGSPAVYPTTVALTGAITFGVAAAQQAQAITFASPGNQTMGTAPPALAASATSGLAVTITSTTTSVCTVSGTTLTLVAAGSCSLTASQAGDATYAAATPVTNTFTVAAGSSTATALTFSSGFAAGNLTNEGGAYLGYGGSNEDGFSCSNPAWCGSGSGGSGATSFFYAYYQTPTPATGLYNGASVLAPGVTALSTTGDTAGVQVNGQTTVNFKFNENPEWAASGTSNFGVILTLGKFYNVGSAGSPAPCNIKLLAVVTPLNGGAVADYAIPLSSFQVIQSCNTSLNTPAAALASAPVSAIDFQGDGGTAVLPTVNGLTTGANLTVPTGSPAVYPTTVALTGGITFQP